MTQLQLTPNVLVEWLAKVLRLHRDTRYHAVIQQRGPKHRHLSFKIAQRAHSAARLNVWRSSQLASRICAASVGFLVGV